MIVFLYRVCTCSSICGCFVLVYGDVCITHIREAKTGAVCGMSKRYQWHDRCGEVCRSGASSHRWELWFRNGELLVNDDWAVLMFVIGGATA